MAGSEKSEVILKLEERVFTLMVYGMVLIATPVVLFSQVSEWQAGRYDWTLAVVIVCYVLAVASLFYMRGLHIRAAILSGYLFIGGSMTVLHFGPGMAIGLVFLTPVLLMRVYFGKRGALICLAATALVLCAAAVAHTMADAPFDITSSTDFTKLENWVRAGLTSLMIIGTILFLLGILHDGLRRAAKEAELALERERREKKERQTAEFALAESQRQEIVSRVAAGTAHDLNNVLTAVMGAADLAAVNAVKRGDVRLELSIISESVTRAKTLTRQLLSFAKSQITQRRGIRIAPVVEGLKGLIQRLTPSNVKITIESADKDAVVFADPSQIEQVILNLCVNARDAMPDGGTLSMRIFEAELENGAPGVAVSVSDTGTGIPDEIRDRIFDPFFTTKADGRGTGLGLATVRIIVEAHQGEIVCDSVEGRGTTMTVRLPRFEEGNEQPLPAVYSTVSDTLLLGSEAILVCDDDELVRETTRLNLEPAGYTVKTVADGLRAMEAAASKRFDLAIIDAVMPGTSGRKLYEAMRREHPRMRFLFCTGYDPGIFGREFFEDPRHHLLAKPFGRDDLLRAVRSAIEGPSSVIPPPP